MLAGEDTVTPSRVSYTLSSRCVVLDQVCQKNSKRNWFKPINIRITLLGEICPLQPHDKAEISSQVCFIH